MKITKGGLNETVLWQKVGFGENVISYHIFGLQILSDQYLHYD